MDDTSNDPERRREWKLGLTGSLVVIWSMAGGIMLGGLYPAFLTATGRMSASGAMPVLTVLFSMGAVMGLLHGIFIAYLGRRSRDRKAAVARLLRGVLTAVPAVALAWVVTLWMGLAGAAADVGLLTLLGALVGWIVGTAICCWAFRLGWEALRNLLRHWQDARIGGSLLVGTFLFLAALFVIQRPQIWWTEIRVTEVGAVLLALGATAWIGAPLLVLALKLVHWAERPHTSCR